MNCERLVKAAGARVVGLHAHTGSGVFSVDNWQSVGETLTALTQRFPDVRTVDLGGGLGVPERLGQQGVVLPEFGAALAALEGGASDS